MACFHNRRFFSLGYNEKKCDSSTSSRVSSRTGVAQGDCEVEKERLSRVRASKQASFIQGAATGNTDTANVPPVLAGAGGPYPQANSLIEGAARVAEHSFRAAEQNGGPAKSTRTSRTSGNTGGVWLVFSGHRFAPTGEGDAREDELKEAPAGTDGRKRPKASSTRGTLTPGSPSCRPSWGAGRSGCWGARRRQRW